MVTVATRNRLIGCVLVFIGATLMSVQGLLFKLTTSIHFTQSLFMRQVGIGFLILPIFIMKKQRIVNTRNQLKWNTIVSVLMILDILARYYALKLMSYADVFALAMSGGMVLTVTLGRVFLKETCGVFEGVVCAFITCGMVLIADPVTMYKYLAAGETNRTMNESSVRNEEDSGLNDSTVQNRIYGLLLVLANCLTSVGIMLSTRKVSLIAHYPVLVLHISIWTSAATFLFTFAFGTWSLPLDKLEWIYLISFVVTGSVSVIVLLSAYTYMEAGGVSTIRTFETAGSYILQLLFLAEAPTLLGDVGAAIVTVGALTYGIRAWIRKILEDKKTGETDDKYSDDDSDKIPDSRSPERAQSQEENNIDFPYSDGLFYERQPMFPKSKISENANDMVEMKGTE